MPVPTDKEGLVDPKWIVVIPRPGNPDGDRYIRPPGNYAQLEAWCKAFNSDRWKTSSVVRLAYVIDLMKIKL